MADRDLVFRLRAENADLQAKLAQSEASLEQFKAANAGVAPAAAAAASALTEEGAAAQSAAAGLAGAAAATRADATANEALAAAIAAAQAAVAELATAAQVGGVEMQAATGRAIGAYENLGIVLATTASTAVVSPTQIAQIEALNAQLSTIPGAERDVAAAAASATAALDAEGAAAKSAAVGLGAAASEAGSAASAQSGLAGAAESAVGGLEAEAGASRAAGAALAQQAAAATEAGAAQGQVAAGAAAAGAALTEEGTAAQVAAVGVTEAGAAAAGAAQFESLFTQSLRENANAHVQAYEAAVAGAGGIEAYTAATNASTAAAAARASSENAVVGALRASRVEFAAATVAVETGSAGMATAVNVAAESLGRLLLETEAVRAAGGIVTPAQLAQVEAYTLQIRALAGQAGITAATVQSSTAALTATGAAAAGAAGQTRLFNTTMAAGGRVIAGGTANLGGMTAGFLRFLGPVGLAIAAITLLPSLVRSLSDAFKQLSELIGIGVSKAVTEMVEGFEKAQEKLEGLDTASRSYKDAADLLIASGLDTAKTFEAMAGSGANVTDELVQMGEGFGQLQTPFDQASAAADRFYKQLNLIRTVDPALGRELTEEFIRLSRAASEGAISADEFAARLEDLRQRAEPAAAATEKLGTAIKEKFGDKADAVGAQLGGLMATIASLNDRLIELQQAGLTSGQAFDVLKSEITKTVQEIGNLSPALQAQIAQISPQLGAWIAQLKELAKGHDAVSVAIDSARVKTQESVNTFNAINAALDVGTAKLGSRAAAIRALESAIEKLIGNIEKQRDSEGNLSVSNQAMLDELVKLQKESGDLTTEAGKLGAAFDEQAKKVAAVVATLHDLDKAYLDDAAEIEKHRATSVTAAHDTADAARQSAVDQLNALNEKNRKAQISNEEYLAEYTRILDEERTARQAALDDELRVNEEARVDLEKVAEERRKQSQKIKDSSAEELRIAQEAYAAQVRAANAVVEKIKEIGAAPAVAAAAFVAGADTITAALDRIRAMAVRVDFATTSAFRTSEGGGGGPPSPTNPVGGGEGVQ